MKRAEVLSLGSSRWGWILLVALSLGTMCAVAPAQESKDDDVKWEKRWRMYESFLKRLDANKNGLIEEDELEGRRKSMVEKMVKRLDMEPKFPLKIDSLREAVKTRFSGGRKPSGSKPEADRSSEDSKPTETDTPKRPTPKKPSVSGFGVQKEASSTAGFGGSTGARVGTKRASGRSSDSTASASPPKSSDPQQDDRITRYATSLMRQHDKNKNGQLEPDEYKSMRSYSKSADTNGDGIISLDELKVGLAKYSERRSKQTGRDARTSSRKRISRSRSSGRPSGRFLTPIERLPDDLPDWFVPQDDNVDGQISMAEFADHWTDSKVAEFRRYDLNGDGILTPAEWLKGQQAEEDEE